MGRSDHEAVAVEVIQDLSSVSHPLCGYLSRHRIRARTVLADGRRTPPYMVDWVDRGPDRRDAVAIVIYARFGSQVRVLLRRQVRVPVFLVTGQPTLLEVVAGVIEGTDSVETAAAKEVAEEAGLTVGPEAFEVLGQPFFPSPASFIERIHVLAVEIPAARLEPGTLPPPPTDGSPLELGADRWLVSLDAALALSDASPTSRKDRMFLADAKTEIGLRRLKERHG
ncbi:MAG TPA: NUDIX domain-containing protein [Myxococcales bacterium LLY-WYZ-16_1]|nr:NUDIX domain-containing protein [Myxococcales bacterium LLY-WYZ-16_1]